MVVDYRQVSLDAIGEDVVAWFLAEMRLLSYPHHGIQEGCGTMTMDGLAISSLL